MQWLSTVAGIDLVKHGTQSDAETIRDTAVAQPLIVGAGLISLLALFEHPADGFRLVPGGPRHSVGEITAAAAAGVISAAQAMVLVSERGQLMAEASAVSATGMSAILGGDKDDVEQTLPRHGLSRCRLPAPSTPSTWPPPSRGWPTWLARSPPMTAALVWCPTGTGRWCTVAVRSSTAW